MGATVNGALEARRLLERQGRLVEGLLNGQLSASWQRCLAAGMDPRSVPEKRMVDPSDLRVRLDRCDQLAQLARVEMESLYQQIAGSDFLIAFGDSEGVVLDTIADPAFAASRSGQEIRAGSQWSEGLAGTNALGTASATGHALIVHGAEHYFSCFDGITCAAAPIHHFDGSLAGALDASSFCDAYPAHTLVLVRMAALNIANGLFEREMRGYCILELHARSEFIGSIAAGLLAVDAAGVIQGFNQQAPLLIPGVDLQRTRQFESLFTESFESVLARLHVDHQTTVRDPLDRAYSLAWRNPARRQSVTRHHLAPRGIHGIAMPRAESHALDPVSRNGARAGTASDAGLRDVNAPTQVLAMKHPASRAEEHPVCHDARVQAALSLIESAVRLPTPILIIGETGTGKEMLARHAHRVSGRKGAYVAVNCAAMPADLFEAELFGYVSGAFTGARREGHSGLIVEADGGTLLLDEIADLPQHLQASLLRFLDDFQVRPVGGRTGRAVDTLIVAATNIDLALAVAQRRFRADLLYRLNTVQVELPPLRERSDLAAVARHVMARIDPGCRLSDAAIALLARHDWPGNVRELRSVLTRARIAASEGDVDVEQLAPQLPVRPSESGENASRLRSVGGSLVRRTLQELGGNVTATATLLGISRNTVYRYIREAGSA
jgi:transcriptional regulator of acetoin/glycerol metabolism